MEYFLQFHSGYVYHLLERSLLELTLLELSLVGLTAYLSLNPHHQGLFYLGVKNPLLSQRKKFRAMTELNWR